MKKLIVIVGPTASGKTETAVMVAQHLNTEIIGADSRQIFKEMTIGTAVPDSDTLAKVRHHMIQNHSIHENFNASKYETEAIEILNNNIFKKSDFAVMCGGSMLYIDAVCNGIDIVPDIDENIRQQLWNQYNDGELDRLRIKLLAKDPDYYRQCDLDNPKRIIHALEICIQTGKPYSSFLNKDKKHRDFQILRIGLNMDRDKLHERINHRVDIMMSQGLLSEAENLYQFRHLNSLNTVGYRELFDYFDTQTNLATAIELIKRNTRRYARKQITWFGKQLNDIWHNPAEPKSILETVDKFAKQ